MTTRETTDRTTLNELSRPFWILFAVSFAGIILLVGLLSVTLNRNAIQSSEEVFEAVIAARLDEMAAMTSEFGYWDAAVTHLVETVDREWFAAQFTYDDMESASYQRIYVVDGEGAPVVSNILGELGVVDPAAAFGAPMAALIRDARATEDNTSPVTRAGIVADNRAYYLAAAVRMTTYDAVNDFSTDHVMVTCKLIDEDLISEIATAYMLAGLKIADSVPGMWQAGVPVRLYPEIEDRYFVWQPELPGFTILPAMLVGLSVAFLIMLATAVSFLRRANRLLDLLTEARARANAANKAKSDFLRNVTHELRTPFNAIVGFADMIRAETFGPLNNQKYIESADDIRSAGNHGLAVVGDLLDLEKIEAGEMDYEYSTFGVKDTVEEAISYVRRFAEEKSITLTLENVADAPPVRSDQRMMRQMMMNLLSNAVKFTPPKGTVTCRAYRHNGSDVAIEVRDTGQGLTPEQIRTVLEPFGQVRNPEGKNYRGTGLGLPLTKKLTESLGGTFRFESVLGQGTTATIILPGAG